MHNYNNQIGLVKAKGFQLILMKLSLTILLILYSTVSYADTRSGLVAWWRLDDLSGTDSSGNGHTGTMVGTPTVVAGIEGNALLFGSGKGMTFSTISTTGTNYSISGWVRMTNVNAQSYQVIINDNPAHDGLWAAAGSGPNYSINMSGSGSGSLNSGTLTQNVWYFLVVSVSSGNGTFYVNNSVISTSASMGNYNLVQVGQGSGDNFFGDIDDLRVYNRALSASDVSQLYQYGTAVFHNAKLFNMRVKS